MRLYDFAGACADRPSEPGFKSEPKFTSDLYVVGVNDNVQLATTLKVEDAKYTSSDTSVATVSESGYHRVIRGPRNRYP